MSEIRTKSSHPTESKRGKWEDDRFARWVQHANLVWSRHNTIYKSSIVGPIWLHLKTSSLFNLFTITYTEFKRNKNFKILPRLDLNYNYQSKSPLTRKFSRQLTLHILHRNKHDILYSIHLLFHIILLLLYVTT